MLNITDKIKEETISIISLFENFEFENELTAFLKQKGYDVTSDTSETKTDDNQTPRLIILVKQK